MADNTTEHLRELDKRYLWHPFTQMKDWCAPEHDPMVLSSGRGAWLTDSEGNQYLDGNSSIWTNIHGHRHPHIDAAIQQQLEQLAHCSALGYTNEPAIRLAERLCQLFPEDHFSRVFYTDDGSTAIECACKMAIQYRQLIGQPEKNQFISFDLGYHGDTSGAASLGGIKGFTGRFDGTGFVVHSVSSFEELENSIDTAALANITAVTIEPLIQGAAGMRIWPTGMLKQLQQWCIDNDILLILDEVMTGFGRTGKLFACEHESVVPDFICLAKGLTGGYLPLAATLTTDQIYQAFLGGYNETFFHGHSYCANPIGCAAALASLEVFERDQVIDSLLPSKIAYFKEQLDETFAHHEKVVDIRQLGLIAGIEIGPFDPAELVGVKVCLAARRYGLLTRPIRDTLVLMPPLCASKSEIKQMVEALAKALGELG